MAEAASVTAGCSHTLPVYAAAQAHLYPELAVVQVPAFRHGLTLQVLRPASKVHTGTPSMSTHSQARGFLYCVSSCSVHDVELHDTTILIVLVDALDPYAGKWDANLHQGKK